MKRKIYKILIILVFAILLLALFACNQAGKAYAVTFATDGGTAVQSVNVAVINSSPTTTKTGYRFQGWYTDEALTRLVTFPFTVTKEHRLYAKWEKLYYVNYYIDGEKTYSYPYLAGEAVASLSDPVREGYTFGGWDRTAPEVMPEEDYDISGAFAPNSYKICFENTRVLITDSSGESITTTPVQILNYSGTYMTQKDGQNVTFPSINVVFGASYYDIGSAPRDDLKKVKAVKEGYDFEGWLYYNMSEHARLPYTPTSSWQSSSNILLMAHFVQPGSAGLSYVLNEAGDAYIVKDYSRVGEATEVVVPTQYNGRTVNAVGDSAFYDSPYLTKVELPYTIKSIGNSAFRNCPSLRTVNIPFNVTDIGISAFEACASLVEITLTSSVKEIKDSTFAYCTSLERINLTSGNLTRIGQFAFLGDVKLASVTAPASVVTIGNFAFQNCTALASVSISNTGVKTIGTGVFMGCTSLQTIALPQVTSIGAQAFEGCASLRGSAGNTPLQIPGTVIEIGARAFYGCSILLSVYIPLSVIRIHAYAFYGCNLNSISVAAETKPEGFDSDWNLRAETESTKTYHTVEWNK
jgi:Listeria/Bacterioides repeat